MLRDQHRNIEIILRSILLSGDIFIASHRMQTSIFVWIVQTKWTSLHGTAAVILQCPTMLQTNQINNSNMNSIL